jgi:hypothetical protein
MLGVPAHQAQRLGPKHHPKAGYSHHDNLARRHWAEGGKMALDPKYTDPVARFHDVLALARGTNQATPEALQPFRLAEVIQQAPNAQAVPVDLARHIALHTALSQASAQLFVNATLPAEGTPQQRAGAVSTAAQSGVGFNGDLELSDPVMLWPVARMWFAATLVVIVFLSVVFMFILTLASSKQETASYAALSVSAGLSLVGVLVLVMGYKNVTIKGGSATG